MWFSREQFELCNELRQWGLEPRFEPGDIVARGFADLGFEEFQVLPGPKLLSLTAGTMTALPSEHAGHFFWIPSIDEAIALLEQMGVECLVCQRNEGREWIFEASMNGTSRLFRGRGLHDVVLHALLETHRARHRSRAA
jgi:hypothetical protein